MKKQLSLYGFRYTRYITALLVIVCASGASASRITVPVVRVSSPPASTTQPAPAPINHAAHSAMSEAAAAAGAGFMLPENIPDFSTDTSRPGVQSIQSGSWSSAATWQGGQIPTVNHVVRVLEGHRVTIDNTTAVAYTIAIDGTLAFSKTVNTRLKVTNLEVMAGEMGMGTPGLLEVGTTAAPIAAGVTAEIIIANSPLGGSVSDTNQFGTGIVVLGKVSMHGSIKTPTFVRLATEPRAGNTTLTLSEAVAGWHVGDRLVLPDTRHIKESEVTGSGWMNAVNQWEERTVQAISADGRTLTLNSGLQYDHLGARDLNGVLDFLPHVGNLTRNLIVRSESATGTRGHMLAIHKAEADIRYTLFKDMGRTMYTPLNTTTNHIGRYPIHMHHLAGPTATPANGYQFTALGNAVDGGSVETKFKWGIAVHGSHYGLIQDNVVYNYNGSAIATEDGSESFNVFDHNFALRGIGEPNNAVSEARMAMGTEGVGFWFRGPNNYVRNNVAANYQNPTAEAAYGFVYMMRYLGNIATPKFKGADTMDAAQSIVKNGNNLPILQFENNEAYGAMQGGFTFWWVSSLDPQPYAGALESPIKDLKIWNVYNKGVYIYPAQKVIFDGLKIRGSFNSLSRCCGNGVYGADYSQKGMVIRNSDIQGMEEGITAPEAGFGPEPNLTIENSYLRNYSNLVVPTNGSVNGCWMENKLVVAKNTRFEAPPGRSLSAISMVRDVAWAPECLSKLDEMRVYAYNGVATDNFQVYHTSSSVVPRPPSGCSPTTRAGINGLLCPIAALGPVPPTVTFSASPASITSGQASTLTWSTTNASSVAINQGIGTVAASGTRSVSPTVTTTYTVTATNSVGSATANATVTVATAPPPPSLTISNPTAINVTASSATITWTTSLAASGRVDYGTAPAYGAFVADPAQVTSHALVVNGLSPATTYHYAVSSQTTAGQSAASNDLIFSTTTTVSSGHNAARANAYDDAWQDGATGWVENAKAILAGGTGQTPGMVIWLGDSLTRDPALGKWAQVGAGKTAEDQAIVDWMHAGLSPQGVDSIDGFALATPYTCSARSYTVGDGLGSWHFMGGSMPADTNPTTARQKLEDCATYPNALNLTTILAAIQGPQFAIPEVNLDGASPGQFPDFERMVDLMISRHIVPIIITYTYRTDSAFNAMVDQYNSALVQYARNKRLPLIDFNNEMLLRLPFSQWPGRFLADGVHYTKGTTQYPPTSDPYANGGDPATHTTGLALTYNGYGLKGWLGVQKMKEIKQLVIDSAPPLPLAISNTAASNVTSTSATITWTTNVSADSRVDYGTTTAYGTVAADTAMATTHTMPVTGLTAATTYHYRVTSRTSAGDVASSADLTVTTAAAPQPPTVTFSASPASITSGQSSTLSWNASNATSVSINQGIGTVAASGTRSVSPTATTTYTVTATNAAGSVTANATVTVTAAPQPPTVTFSASPTSIVAGGSSTLSWNASNATSVSINQGIGTVAASGTRSVAPAATTTYTVTATNAAGSVTANATVTVTPAPVPPTVTFSASPASVVAGGSSTLSWNASNATSVSINQGIGTVAASGTRSVAPAATTTYTVTATNAAGSVTANATVTVTPAPVPPSVTFSASPTSIVAGGSSTLSWNASNATSVSINQGIGTVAASGTRSVAPAATTTYTVTATNAAGSATANAAVTVTPSGTTPIPTVIGSQIAGSFADATGHSGQSHLVYASNAGVWWLFTLTSAADSKGGGTNHVIRAYRSSGSDLATATWTAAGESPRPPSCGSCFMGGGRALGVAYLNNAPVDVVHAEIAMAYDGQIGRTGHIRATVTATSITWGGWNYHDEPAATWSLPRAVALGVSTGKFVHSAGPTLQQEVDANARKSTNADTGAAWTSGFSTVSVIDNSMINASNALVFAPLANNAMLAVYDNGGGVSTCYNCGQTGEPEPLLTNLGYKRSNADGSWPGVPVATQAPGDGQVFATSATIDQNDWTLVASGTAAIRVYRRNAASTGIDAAAYNPSTNTWSAAPAPPAFGTGQVFKKGAGVFGVSDGQSTWLFVVSTNSANSVLYTKYDGTAWTPWAVVPGTASGTHTRRFLSGSPVIAAGQIGLAWTEGPSPFNVFAFSLPVTTTPVADTTAPAVTSVTPGAGATGVGTATTATALFDEAMNASTFTAGTFTLRDAANALVPATIGYNAGTRVSTLTPSQALASSTTYTAAVSGGSGGVADLAGNPLTATYTWTFTTAAAAPAVPVTIWSASATPAGFDTGDTSAVELGLKFRSDVDGTVTGVRFYKGVTTTGTHTGTLWSSTGTRLATATFTNETASGWQQVTFATPVAITANTVYVVSYHTDIGNYAYSEGYFASAGRDTPPLHALANGGTGGNGVYRYGGNSFPTSTYLSTNYWVDVVFVPR